MGAFALLVQFAPPAAADDGSGGGSINAPTMITRPGNYTLRRAMTARSDRPMITIAADDVTLDLSGLTLTGLGGKRGAGIVIEGRTNIAVRNGSLRNFGIAVHVTDSANVRLEGLRISGEDIPGLPPETGILLVNTRAARVTGNLIHNTFLGLFVRGSGSSGKATQANILVNNYLGFFDSGIEERTTGSNTIANNMEAHLP